MAMGSQRFCGSSHARARRGHVVGPARRGAPRRQGRVRARRGARQRKSRRWSGGPRAFAFADVARRSAVAAPARRRARTCRAAADARGSIDYAAQLEAKRRDRREQLRRIARSTSAVAPVLATPASSATGGGSSCGSKTGRVDSTPPRRTSSWRSSTACSPSRRSTPRSLRRRPGRAPRDARGAGSRSRRPRRPRLSHRRSRGGLDRNRRCALPALARGHRAVAGLALPDAAGAALGRHRGDVRAARRRARSARRDLHPGQRGANRLLVETVARARATAAGQRVLDLYAGSGNLSLPLPGAARQVVAVEQDRRSGAPCRRRRAEPRARDLRVVAATGRARGADSPQRGERFDLVVLDPPRSGAAPACSRRCAASRRRASSTSRAIRRRWRAICAPSPSRYRVDAVQPIDMFPHTYHVETVVRAELVSEPEVGSPLPAPRPNGKRTS